MHSCILYIYIYMYIHMFIVKYMHCPTIPVVSEKEDVKTLIMMTI